MHISVSPMRFTCRTELVSLNLTGFMFGEENKFKAPSYSGISIFMLLSHS